MNEEIADALYISAYTVKRYFQNMPEKDRISNRIDLAVNAKANGLVVHEDDRRKRAPAKSGSKNAEKNSSEQKTFC